jgi:hypothetical protein
MRRCRSLVVRRAVALGLASLLPVAWIQTANAWGLAAAPSTAAAPDAPDSPGLGAPNSSPSDPPTAEPVPAAPAPRTAEPEPPGEIGFDEPLGPSPAGPKVRLKADRPQTWLQKRFYENEWRDLCTGACLIHTSPNGTYRLGGRSLRPTDPFQLPRASGSVFIEGKMGTNAQHYTGIGLTIGGVVEALGSVFLLSVASSTTGQHSQDLSNKDFYTFVAALGVIRAAVLLGLGVSFIGKGSSSAQVR